MPIFDQGARQMVTTGRSEDSDAGPPPVPPLALGDLPREPVALPDEPRGVAGAVRCGLQPARAAQHQEGIEILAIHCESVRQPRPHATPLAKGSRPRRLRFSLAPFLGMVSTILSTNEPVPL